MKKVYIIENLDCANCAAKIEEKFRAHPGVQEAVITFSTRQLRLTAEDPDGLIPELVTLARTVEAEVEILPRDSAHGHSGHSCHCGHEHHSSACHCGHSHEHSHEHSHDHSHEHSHEHAHEHSHDHSHGGEERVLPLLMGGGLLAAGLILERLNLLWISVAVCLAAYILLLHYILEISSFIFI